MYCFLNSLYMYYKLCLCVIYYIMCICVYVKLKSNLRKNCDTLSFFFFLGLSGVLFSTCFFNFFSLSGLMSMVSGPVISSVINSLNSVYKQTKHHPQIYIYITHFCTMINRNHLSYFTLHLVGHLYYII